MNEKTEKISIRLLFFFKLFDGIFLYERFFSFSVNNFENGKSGILS